MSWNDLITQAGKQQQDCTPSDIIANRCNGFLFPMPSLSALTITGQDRFKFLQGQVTCDTQRLEKGEALLGAHLNLQGRIEVSFVALSKGESVVLLMPEAQVSHFKALLEKYILFSQAEMNDATDLLPYMIWTDSLDDESNFLSSTGDFSLGCVNTDEANDLLNRFTLGNEDDATAIMARNGFYLVPDSQRGQFLPQELNYEQMDGISFNKGCYKGQEVVARIHFKGQVKQKLQPFYSEATGLAGTTLIDATKKKCGEIISKIERDGHTFGCVLLKTSQTESKTVCLEQNDGPELKLLSPPYAIT